MFESFWVKENGCRKAIEESWAQANSQGVDVILEKVQRKVNEQNNLKLLAPFTRADIERALKQMPAQKSPGYDGLPALFFKQYWEIIGDEVCQLCLGVLNDEVELGDVNHTLLALILKIADPQRAIDFRPISLCTVLYKLISKVIVNRKKMVLDSVISPSQSAFVPGRHIHDNVIAAFETVHSIRRRGGNDEANLVLK
ncbi:hypothetical protein ACLB2K_007678 [Fragaria x ananassa]